MILKRKVFTRSQQIMWQYVMRARHPALFVTMRLGKTLVAIRWAKMRCVERTLIVAPYSAFPGWIETLQEEGISPVVLVGKTETRAEALAVQTIMMKERAFVLVNREGHLVLPQLSVIYFDVVIFDELRFLHNPKSKASRFFSTNFRDAAYRMGLTGTPDTESQMDFFQQLYFLDNQILGGVSYYHFRSIYCTQIRTGEWVLRREGQKVLAAKLASHCLFLSRKDLGNETQIDRDIRWCDLSDRSKKAYDTVVRALVLEIDEQELARTLYQLVGFQWLRRITGGVMERLEQERGKGELLSTILREEYPQEQCVIWAALSDELEILPSKSPQRSYAIIRGSVSVPERRKIRDRFKAGDAQDLYVQPSKCAEFGLDLSFVDTAIYYSSPLSNETRIQTEARIEDIHGSGAKRIVDLMVRNTIDEDIYKSRQQKENQREQTRRIVASLIKAGNGSSGNNRSRVHRDWYSALGGGATKSVATCD